MIDYAIRTHFKNSLLKIDNKKELFRILTIAEEQGFEWGQRTMYGGGTLVSIYDNHDLVAEAILFNGMEVRLNEPYFHEKYVPTEIHYYGEETLAEIRNEEALYGCEMPHYKLIEGYIPSE